MNLAIAGFARDHSAETFEGFMFDCNADYGEVLLCLDTAGDFAERSARRDPTYSRSDIDARWRWDAGHHD